MPEMLAFQRTFEVSGAGPAENREKEESPMNWGHSYCNKLELLVVVFTCPPTCVEMPEMLETSSNVKINVTVVLFCS